MLGGDRRLKRVGAWVTPAQRALHEIGAFLNGVRVPASPVLVFEEHELAVGVEASFAP